RPPGLDGGRPFLVPRIAREWTRIPDCGPRPWRCPNPGFRSWQACGSLVQSLWRAGGKAEAAGSIDRLFQGLQIGFIQRPRQTWELFARRLYLRAGYPRTSKLLALPG